MIALPHDLKAEQAVLGALLFDNALLDRMPLLVGECFFEPVHERLFSVIVRLIRAGRLADGVTLRAMAIRDGALEEIGGAKYLLDLMNNAALAHQAIAYAQMLLELRARREIAVVLTGAATALSAPLNERDTADIIAEAENGLRQITLGVRGGVSLHEAATSLIANITDPAKRGMRTSFRALNERLGGFFPGELILIAGRPSMGKTALATNIARNLAAMGKRGHFASYEMSAESIAARSLSAAAFTENRERFDYAMLRRSFDETPPVDVAKLRDLQAFLPSSLVIDASPAQTVAQLDASIRNTRRRLGGIDFAVVDYLQLMRSLVRGNRVEAVTEISQGLKALGMAYGIPVFALSQLSRANESREDKRPQLHDLRESGSLEQDADVVLGVYREAYYLKRAQPMRANFSSETEFNLADIDWSDKLNACERILEVSTLKQRNGDVGTDTLDFWAKYDVAADAARR